MTNDKIALQALLEKTSDASMLRDMISFAAERLMALEPSRCVAPHPASAARSGSTSVTAIATATGKRAQAPSSCAFRSYAMVPTFQASSNRAAWQRKR